MSTPLATHQDSIVKTVTPRDASSPTPITMTQSAINKIRELIEDEGNPELSLRVFITGGGCSGFQYGFTFDETVQADDFVIQPEEKTPSATVVRLLVDPMSAQYLMGAVIDYTEDLTGAQFIIRNPNAKTTCGCGSSFSADVPDEETDSEE